MQYQRLTFRNMQGKRLEARLDLPADEKPVAYALFAHCFTCTKNLNAVVNINRTLARRGFAVLRFDFTGIGESEGDFKETTFSTNVTDLIAAADFLSSNYEPPKLLIGHSLGGAAVIQAASRIPSVSAIATIGAPSSLLDVAKHFADAGPDPLTGERTIKLAGRSFPITQQFIDDLAQTHMEKAISNLGRALIVLHSPRDELVGIHNADRIFQAARHPKSYVSLDTADHLLTNRADSIYVGSVLSAWARKYIDVREEEVRRQKDPADNRIVVRTGKAGYQTEIIANGHNLIADEPIAVGGADTGPSPYDLLVAALGACTTITLRMYGDRKQWPLDSIVVRLRHQKIHAKDCERCETREGKIDFIEREIELHGALSEEQRARLLEIADRCPVHRSLHSEIFVKSWLKDSP